MNRTNRPAYWQLNLFTLLMIALMVLAMMANLSSLWMTVVDSVWAVFTVAGMAVWVWINRAALQFEEQEQRAALARTPDSVPIVKEREAVISSPLRPQSKI